ncbi:hypothetical protein GOP47_0007888 [Adiantum capillus-veneris]|uniref:Uncharacterized protein n=1 Tax=Adiantum capillus-veneris TaxID=13818 RepID=A0A9D4V1X6_ADICA|nr:hypothetical protein GOP47_0007888 [Adiantum capillus-veneris]
MERRGAAAGAEEEEWHESGLRVNADEGPPYPLSPPSNRTQAASFDHGDGGRTDGDEAPAAPLHSLISPYKESPSDHGDGNCASAAADDDAKGNQRTPSLHEFFSLETINGGLQELLCRAALQQAQIRDLINSIGFSSFGRNGVCIHEELPCGLTSTHQSHHHVGCSSAHLHSQLLLQIARLQERIKCVTRELVVAKARSDELQSRLALAMSQQGEGDNLQHTR